jgi:HAE1 family hydrophobic/amphiphilic exporter-1
MCRWARPPTTRAGRHQRDRPGGAGHHLSIVAVFLPIGFMGGIIGKFFHEFGITIVAAVLISMFVSFTLDPMLSSVWHDPASTATASTVPAQGPVRPDAGPRHPRGGPPVDRLLSDGYQAVLGWSLVHKGITLVLIAVASGGRTGAGAAARHRVRAQGRLLSETSINFYTPVGSSAWPSHRGTREAGRRHPARDARGALHAHHHQHRLCAGRNYGVSLRAPGRPQGPQRSVDQMSVPLRERLAPWPASPSPMSGCSMPWAAASRSRCRSRAPTSPNWSASPPR